ncbi:DNA-binding transcriptional LysR family regulator [Pararhizobium capsulatum DSM 1112]|uniref:DNA-binding transcriptional LysR family regulator n=1 Tax=Pararhizobium capsulatum DSM 1112 TaxID=1121113 RepID=A0ABU0BY33_9HYPH|nr:DNA-binding transcriptional LysR family regulator [Pararhizobium capsulatum DSM 1112]
MRLLTRTTRSVSLTEAGERLLDRIGPHFDEIESEIAALSELRDKPSGTVRITTVEHAAETILWPGLQPLLVEYPDIGVEIISDYGLKDIVAERYDAGVRLGEQVDKDMISVPICAPFRFAIVGALDHDCIRLRLPTHGGFWIWDFAKDGRDMKARVQGRTAFNTGFMMRQAALSGFGVAYVPEDTVEAELRDGRLLRVLEDWCPLRPAYHLYYPSRRQPSPAFALIVETLRYRRGN